MRQSRRLVHGQESHLVELRLVDARVVLFLPSCFRLYVLSSLLRLYCSPYTLSHFLNTLPILRNVSIVISLQHISPSAQHSYAFRHPL
jgi:hypothetical protein